MADPAFIAVYRESVQPLYAYVARRCGGCRDLAEDVTQETFLRAVRQWQEKGPPDEPLAWLRTVARNLLITHYRRRTPQTIAPGDVERLLEQREAESPTAAGLIHWGLARLNGKSARVLEAFHLEGRPVKAIAAEAGLSERAVEGRLHRARHALRRELAPLVEDAGGDP